jgi:hypothetical protein
MSRLITTIVQLFLAGGAIVCIAMMWQDIKQDIKEIKNDLRR